MAPARCRCGCTGRVHCAMRRRPCSGSTAAGFISGSPEQDEASSIGFARYLGITVVALRYRLAPAHPSPAAVEDAYAGLRWVFDQAEARGIDPTRIAIGGASAGGGLAAGLVLYAHDRGRCGRRSSCWSTRCSTTAPSRALTWTPATCGSGRRASNRFGWTSYLGVEPGSDGVSPYAAPARRERPQRAAAGVDRGRLARPVPRRGPGLRRTARGERGAMRARRRAGSAARIRCRVPRRRRCRASSGAPRRRCCGGRCSRFPPAEASVPSPDARGRVGDD